MSLRTFLFAADALRLEDGVSFHVKTEARATSASTGSTGTQNADAMAAFMGMMGGVQKRRRR